MSDTGLARKRETSAKTENIKPTTSNDEVSSYQHGGQGHGKTPSDQLAANALDRLLHAKAAHLTGSLSPASLMLAFLDWSMHLASAPGRQVELSREAFGQWVRLASPTDWRKPSAMDHRFGDEGWQQMPFNYIAQAFLLGEEWWRAVANGPPGVSKAHTDMVSFTARQILDVFSPSNFPWMNPEVLRSTAVQGGRNIANGFENFMEDFRRLAGDHAINEAGDFVVGEKVATTPGKVILRNALMELIQYEPTTAKVHPEPILIVPAWIMKYYILDLSPHNSLIRYLVSEGFTVYCISWRNPGPEHRETALDDYRRLGVMAALDAVTAVCNVNKVHACGYCLGGTLLTIAAAAMSHNGDDRLASVTLLAAQTDFTEAGELRLFTDESQLALLEDVMSEQGYLDSSQMAGAFQMLRSRDLVWSRMIKSYLLGEQEHPNDMMAWNKDATRMPFRMHSEYLRRLFHHNDLAEGRYRVDLRPVVVADIPVPIFAVGTETDHVAPWESVYKIHLLNQGDITFLLTSGGHNAGIVSEPGHPHRSYRIGHSPAQAHYLAPEDWLSSSVKHEGSWWPAWAAWLRNHSGDAVPPPPFGTDKRFPAVADAPGDYVRER